MFLGSWWNTFSWGEDILNGIVSFFYGMLLALDAIIYSFISYVYQIFLALAQGGDILNGEAVEGLVNRIYIIIGVIMLFIIAYSLLKAMINLDDLTKGKQSPVNIIKDVIISVVLIAILPTLFDFAFAFQNSLLINNTIGKIIVGNHGGDDPSETIRMGGYEMAAGIFTAFLHANETYCNSLTEEQNQKGEDGSACKTITISVDGNDRTFGELWELARENTTFWKLMGLGPKIVSGEVSYYFIISPIAGIFVVFVLLSYCLDMALRLVKLAVYELIAPIPILARIIPNDQAKKVFSNWVKATVTTFVEVFIRIAILYFAVLLIKTISGSIGTFFGPLFSGSARLDILLLAQALIIIGIVLFVKQAPEIIKEITGLDGGKYNPLTSAKQGLSLIAGGIAGGSPVAAFRAWEQAGKTKDFLDFTAIGNQYKRKQAAKEAQAQGATRKDRIGDSFRKRFGFDTKLGRSDRYLERGLDMEGNAHKLENDSGQAIYALDENGKKIPIYQKNADGSYVLDASGNKVQAFTTDSKGNRILLFEEIIGKNEKYEATEQMMNTLQNLSDQIALFEGRIKENMRHVEEGKALNQTYFDTWSNMKKEADDKINDGNNDVFGAFYEVEKDATGRWQYKLDSAGQKIVLKDADSGQALENMNYAALLKYTQAREAQGASPQELEQLQANLKMAHDDIRDRFLSREAQAHRGRTSQLTTEFLENYQANGIYDAETGEQFWFDMDVKDMVESGRMSEIFTAKNVARIRKDGTAYTGTGTTQLTGKGMDITVKEQSDRIGGLIQQFKNELAPLEDEKKSIDRQKQQMEEKKTIAKSSTTYQRYKASDTANKINDSGKN